MFVFRPVFELVDVAELLPRQWPMELITGRKMRRGDTRTEQMFRFPATEEIWEVACVEEREYEEREIQTARKRPDLPIAS